MTSRKRPRCGKENKLQVSTCDGVKNYNVLLTKLEKRGLLKHNLIN